MPRKKKKTFLSTVGTVFIIAAVIWMKYQENKDSGHQDEPSGDHSVEISAPQDQSEEASVVSKRLTPVSLSSNKFEVLEGCRLIDHRGNDGDSFHVETPKGREEVRLYYVDAPESAARTYRNGDTNHKRISDQGKDMGGLDQGQTTAVGVEAKKFVKKAIAGKKFTLATTREKVYGSHRIYSYVIVEWDGEPRYLHEILVARGLVRIHTKPMTLPDNTSSSRHRERLQKLQSYAQSQNYGAWGIR